MNRVREKLAILLLSSVYFTLSGCSEEMLHELETVSSVYLSDVVSIVATGCLSEAMDIEPADDGHGDAGEHSHDSLPLHDHEH